MCFHYFLSDGSERLIFFLYFLAAPRFLDCPSERRGREVQNMSTAVDPTLLKAQMAADDFDDLEVAAAKRRLVNFKKPATKQNLDLVMAVTRMLKGKNVTISIFKNAEEVHVQSLKESQKVLKVPTIWVCVF